MAGKNQKVFEELRREIKATNKYFASEFADEFLERVKRKTPVRTGRLQAGWAADVEEEEISIYNDVEYAEYVEDGTERMSGAHMLKATAAETDEIAESARKRANRRNQQ